MARQGAETIDGEVIRIAGHQVIASGDPRVSIRFTNVSAAPSAIRISGPESDDNLRQGRSADGEGRANASPAYNPDLKPAKPTPRVLRGTKCG